MEKGVLYVFLVERKEVESSFKVKGLSGGVTGLSADKVVQLNNFKPARGINGKTAKSATRL